MATLARTTFFGREREKQLVAELVDRVVHRLPGARVLATSREPLGVEGEQVVDEGGQGLGERRVRPGGSAQHARGELEAGGVGEEAGGRLQADAQAVVGQQAAREGVVRRDHRLARRVVRVQPDSVGAKRRR